MPQTIIDKGEVLIIRHNGEGAADPECLKNELLAEADTGKVRDTILQLLNPGMICSSEIGVIIHYLKTFPQTGKTLRLVASNYVCEMLRTMNVHRIPNLVMYTSMEELQELFPGVDLSVP